MSGQELQIQQSKIVRLQQMATHAAEVVVTMEATIERAKVTQTLVEGKVAMAAADMQLRETMARTDVAMEKLYGTVEMITDSQLRAAGYLQDRRVKDHSGELSRRASKARGRAESAQRVTNQVVGSSFNEVLTDDEQETLRAAYEAAGATLPEQAASEKAAS
jgi:hypothetical protein